MTAPQIMSLARHAVANGLPVRPYFDQLRTMWPEWQCNETTFVGKLRRSMAANRRCQLTLVPVTVAEMTADAAHLAATIGGTTGVFQIINGVDPERARKFAQLFRIEVNQL